MDEFSLVYDAAAERKLSWRDCDDAEIWVLASQLGANRPDDSDALTDADGLDWNARRTTALAQGLPEPQWDDVPPTAKEIADMQRLMMRAP